MPPTRPLAVLFDLDGTLVDTIELILRSMQFAFRSRGLPVPSDEEWTALIGTPLLTQLRAYSSSEEEAQQLLAAYRVHQLAHHDRLTRCFDDVVDTVGALHDRGHPMALVTSKSDALASRALAHVGLDTYIPTVLGCDSCTRHKPDPEPVRLALERLGYGPREAVFVGDSPYDIASGNAAGVTTIAALWGPFRREKLEPAGPAYYLERIGELPPLLDLLEGLELLEGP